MPLVTLLGLVGNILSILVLQSHGIDMKVYLVVIIETDMENDNAHFKPVIFFFKFILSFCHGQDP